MITSNDDLILAIPEIFSHAIGSNQITNIFQISDGFCKTSFKIVTKGNSNYLLQFWREPLTNLTTIGGPDVDALYPGGLKQTLKIYGLLHDLFIDTPKIIYSDEGTPNLPAYAIFEFIEGTNFNLGMVVKDEQILKKMGNMIGKIHSHKDICLPMDCTNIAFKVFAKEFELAFEYSEYVKKHKQRILDAINLLKVSCKMSTTQNLICGDGFQIIIDKNNNPYLIDIETYHMFDLEYDYCQMKNLLSSVAFKDNYFKHITPNCDVNKLLFYGICKQIAMISFFAEQSVKNNGHDRRISG